MTHRKGRGHRGATALLGAVFLAACAAGPAPTIAPATTTPSTIAASTPTGSTPSPSILMPDRRPGPPAAFERVATLHGAAVDAPRLVAVPGGSFLMLMAQDIPGGRFLLRSDDGRTWDKVDMRATGLDAGSIVDLAASDTTVVVLGTLTPLDGSSDAEPDLAEWTSSDGVTWTRVSGAETLLREIDAGAIVASPIGFAATGVEPSTVLMSGPDGRTWRRTEVPTPPGAPGSVGLVAPAGSGFVATGTMEVRDYVWRWDGAAWLRLGLTIDEGVTITGTSVSDPRVVVTGLIETPDPARPDLPTLRSVAWQSTDGGATWGSAGLPLEGITDIGIFALNGGFLAVLAPLDPEKPLSAWRSVLPGVWEPVSLADAGRGWDRPLVGALAVSGSRVVLAGNTVGTGAGGDRVVVWIGETTAP